MIQKQIKEKNLSKNTETPLYIAAFNDSYKIGELLIAKGADISPKDVIY